MIVAFWIALRILFFATALVLLYAFYRSLKEDDSLKIFIRSLQEALIDCGFYLKNRNYSVELYRWATDEWDEDICEEALDRTTWEPMDIADWMKEGLPQDADGESLCGRDCNCRLALARKKIIRQQKKQI